MAPWDDLGERVTENQFAPVRLSSRSALLVEGGGSGTSINVAITNTPPLQCRNYSCMYTNTLECDPNLPCRDANRDGIYSILTSVFQERAASNSEIGEWTRIASYGVEPLRSEKHPYANLYDGWTIDAGGGRQGRLLRERRATTNLIVTALVFPRHRVYPRAPNGESPLPSLTIRQACDLKLGGTLHPPVHVHRMASNAELRTRVRYTRSGLMRLGRKPNEIYALRLT